MVTILAADTSTSINTVAVCTGEISAHPEISILAEVLVECRRLHSERLIATIDWVLSEAGLSLDDVNALAVSIGPGSFTGLRIGAATWKGLAFAKKLPLVGVPTLDAMTRLGCHYDAVVSAVLDARMKEVFGAVYRFTQGQRRKLTQDRVCPVEALLQGLDGPVHIVGNAAVVYRERILLCLPDAVFAPGFASVPRASAVAAEALALLAAGAPSDAAQVAPVYLRPSQAEMNRALREQKAGTE